MSHPVG